MLFDKLERCIFLFDILLYFLYIIIFLLLLYFLLPPRTRACARAPVWCVSPVASAQLRQPSCVSPVASAKYIQPTFYNQRGTCRYIPMRSQ